MTSRPFSHVTQFAPVRGRQHRAACDRANRRTAKPRNPEAEDAELPHTRDLHKLFGDHLPLTERDEDEFSQCRRTRVVPPRGAPLEQGR